MLDWGLKNYVHTYVCTHTIIFLEYAQIGITGGNFLILDIEGHSMTHWHMLHLNIVCYFLVS